MSYEAWPLSPGAIVALVIALFVAAFILKGVRKVPVGEAWTVERMGRYVRTLPSGVSFVLPIFERVGRKIAISEQDFTVPPQEVRTADDIVLRVGGTFAYRVTDPARVANDVADVAQAMSKLASDQLRAAIAAHPFADLPSKRGDMQQQLLSATDQAAQDWGVKVARAEMGDIVLPATGPVENAPIIPPPVR